jgi:SAM-dependent methyltransferase
MNRRPITYASYTRDTTEPLKAIAHRKRYAQVAKILGAQPSDTFLDYGCADGHLFLHLPHVPRRNMVGYDPDAELLAEMEPELRCSVRTYSDRDSLIRDHAGRFSLIACVEVFEHLLPDALNTGLTTIHKLAAPDARIVIGVPIETGPSGFTKNVYRLSRKGRQGATLGKAVRSLLGLKIEREPGTTDWTSSHIGFRDRQFRKLLLTSGFNIHRTDYLPLPVMGRVFNNEIYFICSVRKPE